MPKHVAQMFFQADRRHFVSYALNNQCFGHTDAYRPTDIPMAILEERIGLMFNFTKSAFVSVKQHVQ